MVIKIIIIKIRGTKFIKNSKINVILITGLSLKNYKIKNKSLNEEKEVSNRLS